MRYIIVMISRALFWFLSRVERLYWLGAYYIYRQRYNIDSAFSFNGVGTCFYGDGSIVCGKESYVGRYSSIQSANGAKVIIGKNCEMSHFVNIYTFNNLADQDFRISKKTKTGDVTIGDYCWIGIKVSIFGPVVIGENTVVGANSVVNRNLPPHSICAGVPAEVVKFKSYLTDEQRVVLAREYENVLSDELRRKYCGK